MVFEILFYLFFLLLFAGIIWSDYRDNIIDNTWHDGPKGEDGKVMYQFTETGGKRIINPASLYGFKAWRDKANDQSTARRLRSKERQGNNNATTHTGERRRKAAFYPRQRR